MVLMAIGLGSLQAQDEREELSIEDRREQLVSELAYLNSIDKSELDKAERKTLRRQKNSIRSQLSALDRMNDPYRYDPYGRRMFASRFYDPYGFGYGFYNPYRFARPVVIVRRAPRCSTL